MGWAKGFEPSTSGTTNQRSNQLSYAHHIFYDLWLKKLYHYAIDRGKNGGR